jgi:hypothetical protein
MRWYDGTQWTPHAAAAGPVGPVERYDAQKGATTAQWAGWAFVARGILVGLQALIVPVVFASFFDDVRTAVENPDSTTTIGTSSGLGFSLVAQIGGLLVWACLAAIMVWTFRTTKNANLLGLRTRFSPGWAVAGWIIPLASLVMPYLAVRDVFPEGHSGQRAAGFWWATEIAGSVIAVAAFVVAMFAGGGPGVAVGAVAAACSVAAGVQGLRLTRAAVQVQAELAHAIGAA